jgi:CHAD domain-containing protein
MDPVPLDPTEPSLHGYRRVLADLLATIDATLDGAAAGDDPEELHDLRVAVRRTRSVLRDAKGVIPAEVRRHHQQGLRWLGGVTGPVRDLDVMAEGWAEAVAPLGDEAGVLDGLRDDLARARATAQEGLAGELRSARCDEVLGAWRAWLATPVVPEGRGAKPLGPVVATRIAKAEHRVRRRGRHVGSGASAERLHRVRKDAKRLRYLLDCFGGLFPERERDAYVDRLKALQDDLGAHQDAVVHGAILRDLARGRATTHADPDELIALGRLLGGLDQRAAEARAGAAGHLAALEDAHLDRLLRPLQPPKGQR